MPTGTAFGISQRCMKNTRRDLRGLWQRDGWSRQSFNRAFGAGRKCAASRGVSENSSPARRHRPARYRADCRNFRPARFTCLINFSIPARKFPPTATPRRRCVLSSKARALTRRPTASAMFMEPGDLLVQPNWTWHGTTNPGKEPVFWLDIQDRNLVNYLGAFRRDLWPDDDVEPTVHRENHYATATGLIRPAARRTIQQSCRRRITNGATRSRPSIRSTSSPKRPIPTMAHCSSTRTRPLAATPCRRSARNSSSCGRRQKRASTGTPA